jgi:hypothetical protein
LLGRNKEANAIFFLEGVHVFVLKNGHIEIINFSGRHAPVPVQTMASFYFMRKRKSASKKKALNILELSYLTIYISLGFFKLCPKKWKRK